MSQLDGGNLEGCEGYAQKEDEENETMFVPSSSDYEPDGLGSTVRVNSIIHFDLKTRTVVIVAIGVYFTAGHNGREEQSHQKQFPPLHNNLHRWRAQGPYVPDRSSIRC